MFESLEGDLGYVALFRIDDAGHHVADAEQHAREYARGEELADVEACGVGVDYHDDARRYDRPYASGGDHDGRGPAVLIASLLEGAQADGAEGGGVGVGGAGDAGHEYAGQLDRAGQASAHPAYDGICKVYYRLCNACPLHDLPGQHEEGDGQQREAVHGGVHLLAHDETGDAAVLKQPDHRGQAEAEQDGRAEYEQRGKDRYAYPEYHGCTSFPFLACMISFSRVIIWSS